MKNRILPIMIILVILFISTSCSDQISSNEELTDIGTIQIGYLPILPSAPIYIAYENGYFAEQGLDVELQSFNSASFQMPLLASGDLDIGGGQPGPEIFNAIFQGMDIKIVGGLSQDIPGHGTNAILIRKDLFDSGSITKPEDFRGAKIALNVERGLSEYILAEILSRGGLTLKDVEIVIMPFPDMNAAFLNQAIDIAHMVQPLAGQAIMDGNAVMLFNGDEVFENGQYGVLYFGKRLLKPENREVGIRLLTAYLKGVRELSGGGWKDEEKVAIVSNYTNIPVPAIIHGVEFFNGPNGEFNEIFIENIMRYYFEQGYTELTEPLPLTSILDTSYMDAALERLGPYED